MSAEDEPQAKKLRSCEPDLKVTIGSAENKVVRWYHAAILANHSAYVDAMLSSDLKESQSKEISFPDITPETWDAMLKYVEDPVAGRTMQVKDIHNLDLAKHFDKYDFKAGRDLCEQTIMEYIERVSNNEKAELMNANLLVDTVVMAVEANLEKAKHKGMEYIWRKLSRLTVPFGRAMFAEGHMKKLAPLLLEDSEHSRYSSYGLSKKEIASPDFPEMFVLKCRSWVKDRIIWEEISHITVSGTYCEADGDYFPSFLSPVFETRDERKGRWDGVEVTFRVSWETDNWVIVRDTLPTLDEDGEIDHDSIVTTVCWESPCSGNLTFPPKQNWIPVDPLARGTPKIEYFFRSS
jgi:hypothetical protein